MNMVEKVARAIDPRAFMPGEHLFESWRAEREKKAFIQARAAIEAMRDPTKEMVEAGYDAIDHAVDYYCYDSDQGYTIEPTGGADVLRAMIDAALKE